MDPRSFLPSTLVLQGRETAKRKRFRRRNLKKKIGYKYVIMAVYFAHSQKYQNSVHHTSPKLYKSQDQLLEEGPIDGTFHLFFFESFPSFNVEGRKRCITKVQGVFLEACFNTARIPFYGCLPFFSPILRKLHPLIKSKLPYISPSKLVSLP